MVKTPDGGVVKTLGGSVTKQRHGKCSTRWGKQEHVSSTVDSNNGWLNTSI